MALIKTSSDIVTIRGRFGGVYFKTGPDGKHVQAMPRVWNYTRSPAQKGGWGPGSPFMSAGIDGWSGAAGLWLMALLAFFAAAWFAYALAHWFTTRYGEKKHITGYNWYMYYGLRFPECERPPFWKPPHSPGELPDFMVTYQGTWMYERSPPEWPGDCPAGYYWEGTPAHGKPTYHADDFEWFLWWLPGLWVLSPGVDYQPAERTFYSSGENIIDYYRNWHTGKWSHVYLGKPPE